MIPKIIHYCWLSNDPIPDKLKRCMDSWKKYLPDYEIIWWNFDKFPKGKSKWVDEAFLHKKYAFAADYIRLYALYNYGGIYLDMDVEVINSFNAFLNLDTMICRQNKWPGLEVAAFGAQKGSTWVKECLDLYDKRSFILNSGNLNKTPMPYIIENYLTYLGYEFTDVRNILEAEKVEKEKTIPVFDPHFFSPKSYKNNKMEIREETICIHHFEGSWLPQKKWYSKVEGKIWNFIGLHNKNIIERKLLRKNK